MAAEDKALARDRGTVSPAIARVRRRSANSNYSRRRAEVLDAAATLFARKGYEATSIGDIADAVGLLKGSLYYYAPSKEELLFSIISEVLDKGRELVERCSSSSDDPVTQLRAVIAEGVTVVIQNSEKNMIAMRDFHSLSDMSQRELAATRAVVPNYIRTLIEAGKRQGRFRANVDAAVATSAILGAINYVPAWYESGKGGSLSRIVKGFRDFLVDGLLPTQDSPSVS